MSTASTVSTASTGTPPEAYFDDYPIRIRELTVLRRTYVTPRMVRVTLGGPNLAGFESHQADEHCKLVFPDPDTGAVRVPWQAEDGEHLDWPDPFPPTREYTIRRYDPVAQEVDLDFVVHPGGVASQWAQEVVPGETLWLAGPRPSLIVPPEFGFLVLLADETGLPAVARWLDELPDDARGVAAIEVADAAEEQDLRVPAGFSLTWLHRDGAPAGTTRLLGDFAERIELPADTWTYVWAFAEAGCIRPVRRWARAQGIGKKQSDIGGYWKLGRTNAVQDVVADPARLAEMDERQREHEHDPDEHDHG